MKYFVYFLKSLKNNNIYDGSAFDIDKRLKRHNSGKVKSTKGYRPWIILDHKEFNSRSEAMISEKFYKTGQQKEILKNKYK